jgi:IPT/TIG domain
MREVALRRLEMALGVRRAFAAAACALVAGSGLCLVAPTRGAAAAIGRGRGAVSTVASCASLQIQTAALPSAKPGAPYSAQLAVCGGAPPYKWKKVGKLPKGMKLSKTGVLTWMPKAALETSSYPIGVAVSDSARPKESATAAFELQLFGTPVITSVKPAFVPETGATLTIAGHNLLKAERLSFFAPNFGAISSSGPEQATNTSMTLKFPGCEVRGLSPTAFAFEVDMTTPRGSNEANAGDHFTCIVAPVVSSFEPREGPQSGHTSVTIKGEHFIAGGTEVKFGSASALRADVTSPDEIVAESPPGTGEVQLSVTTTGGSAASSGHFTYVPPPSVTGVEPTEGPEAGKTSVTISGSNLSNATAVKFGSSNATSFKVESPTSVTAVSPAGAGAVDVTVTTSGGTSATSSADHFTYVPPPSVIRVQPAEGPEAGKTSVTISGSNLVNAKAVKFGSSDATSFEVQSPTSITAVSPAGAGTVDVTVTTAGGTTATTSADHFTYVPPPTVAELTPNAGTTFGKTPVVIKGANFGDATAVKFGSVAAEEFAVESPTQIKAVSPPGTGTVDVVVTTAHGGASAASEKDHFTYIG